MAASSAAGSRGGAAPGGGKVQSTETSKRLEISWSVRQLPKVTRAGYSDSALPLGALFDRRDLPGEPEVKPAMILFTRLQPDEKVEKRMFDSLEVAVASRWFDCVKIYVDDIDSKAERQAYSKVVPAVVFLDGSGHEVSRLGGNVTATGIYSEMQKTAASDFKKPLASMVDKYSAFLKRFDKAQGKVSDLEAEIVDDLAHVSKHDCAPGRRMLKEHEEEIKPLQAQRDKLLEEEKGLLKPELK